MAGTTTWADVYGEPTTAYQMAAPISGSGPNQSFVAPAFTEPGTFMGNPGKAPAISLMGLAVALILWRIAVEMGGES